MPSHSAVSPWRRFSVRLIAVAVIGVLIGAGYQAQQPRTGHQPQILAAVSDVLTTTNSLPSSLSQAPQDSLMVGQVSGVRLVEYGFVNSYGWADQERRAPSGFRLLAFATQPLPGETDTLTPDLSVRVDGVERGPLTPTSEYRVTAVPQNAQSVELLLTDSGIKQSISLLTGAPGPTNPVVTTRTNTSQMLTVSKPIRVKLTTPAGTGTLGGTLSVRSVSLSFWAANGAACAGPDRAWLHIAATVKFEGDKQAYGAEAGLISVSLPEAAPASAHNIASDPTKEVDDAVDVPASLTSGSLSYSGAVKTAKGTITVLTPITVPFEIPAG